MLTYKELNLKAREIEKQNGLQHLEVYQRFMFERILERISVSKYKENFILKGGLLLSAMFGIDNRSTIDMDMSIKGISISKEKMIKILNEILSIKLEDHVKFEIQNVTDIREDNEYGGNKYHILAKLENLSVSLEIDISTGDEIIPSQLNYKYDSLFENKSFYIESYNTETILSEKIETVLRRTLYNGRMKDFYDIYMFLIQKRDEIDLDDFKKAFKTILIHRNSYESFKDYNQIFDSMKSYERIHIIWDKYRKRNKYAKSIEFDNIIDVLRAFLDELDI